MPRNDWPSLGDSWADVSTNCKESFRNLSEPTTGEVLVTHKPVMKSFYDLIKPIFSNKTDIDSTVYKKRDGTAKDIGDIIKKEYSHLNDEEIINKVIDKLINDNLLLQSAERFGINISDIALEKEVNNIAKKQNISITQLRNNIIQSGQDYTKYIENFRNRMTIEALFVTQFYSRTNVTEEDVENFLKSSGATRYQVKTVEHKGNRAIKFYTENGFFKRGRRAIYGRSFMIFEKKL